MLEALLIHGMAVQGSKDDKHYGPTAVESPDKKEIVSRMGLSERAATLTAALKR